MQPKALMAIGASLIAAFVVSVQARAQGWNYYNGFNSLPNVAFTNGPMTSDRTASVFFNLNGTVSPFTIDTGSTGIAATSGYYKPGPNDIALGAGTSAPTGPNFLAPAIPSKGPEAASNVERGDHVAAQGLGLDQIGA